MENIYIEQLDQQIKQAQEDKRKAVKPYDERIKALKAVKRNAEKALATAHEINNNSINKVQPYVADKPNTLSDKHKNTFIKSNHELKK